MTYVLSADGYAVVRLTPQGTVSASSLNTSLLKNGFTATTGTGGSLSLAAYAAGFKGGTGGAEIRALYDRGSSLGPGQSLEWVQVITTNVPLGGATSPYLDNGYSPLNPNAPSAPFYTLTAYNKTSGLPASQLNFYDFSRRDPATLSSLDTITWNANLYPVIWDGNKSLTVVDGVSWGWTMKKAMVGTATGLFTSPSPGSATVTGVGTSTFTWGSGDPSSLSFAGSAFDTKPNTRFKLGTLTYRNGTIAGNSGADSVKFSTPISFANVPEKNFSLETLFTLVNTPNTSDPIASADTVTIGNYGYTFNVQEGATASVDIYATLSTGLTVSSTGSSAGASAVSSEALDPTGGYTLSIVGLSNPTSGGFVKAAFSIDDRTANQQIVSGGTPYTGPVAGLQYQYIDTAANNLNITAGLANVFIHTGSGTDAIDVSAVGGRNVLDGGTNSNFLVGGSSDDGYDTFFVDDRNPPSNIWSTVANFKRGDDATVFGVSPNAFTQTWTDGQGAAGYTGLTAHFTAAGAPTASLTLAGYSTADLNNGRLTTSFGTLADGTSYFHVHANA